MFMHIEQLVSFERIDDIVTLVHNTKLLVFSDLRPVQGSCFGQDERVLANKQFLERHVLAPRDLQVLH